MIVRAILDLAGYTADRPLHQRRLLEPSFGGGDFLLPALDRLLGAYQRGGGLPDGAALALRDAIRAEEVDVGSFDGARAAAIEFHEAGMTVRRPPDSPAGQD